MTADAKPQTEIVFPTEWARFPEVIDYALGNKITLAEAIMQLVNKGLSHE